MTRLSQAMRLRTALVGGVLVLLALPLGPAVAAAEPGDVQLESLSPVLLQPTSDLTLSGTVTNPNDNSAEGITVTLQVSDEIVPDRQALTDIQSGQLEPSRHTVFAAQTSVPESLAPKAAGKWTIKAPASSLGLTSSGVYYVQVSVQSSIGELGSTGTSIPWFPASDSVDPIGLAWLWPVSDWPDRAPDNSLLSNSTGAEVSQNGRLSRVLDWGLAAGGTASWALDPQVLQTVDEMADGYTVTSVDGQTVAGPDSAAAAAWMSRARTGFASRAFYALPYADPDVTALTTGGANLSDVVVQSATTASERVTGALGRAPTSVLGWPAGDRVDVKGLDALHRAGVREVVLDHSAVVAPAAASTASVGTEAGQLTSLLYDPELSALVSNSGGTRQSEIQARQSFLSFTALAAQNSPAGTTIVVAPSPTWNPSQLVVPPLVRNLPRARWLRTTTASTVLSAARATSSPTATLAAMTPAARRAALGPRFTTMIRSSQRRLASLAAVVDSPDRITEPFSSAIMRLGSSAWRTERAAGIRLGTTIESQLKAEIGSVRVLAGGVKNLSNDRPDIPITIANDLPVPVHVGLVLTANPAIRLSAQPMPTTTIPANRKVSVSVQAQVVGSGEVDALAQLTTPDGTPYGQPVAITLRNSAYSVAATWVVVVAFAILVLLLIGNSVRRRRERLARAQDAGSADD